VFLFSGAFSVGTAILRRSFFRFGLLPAIFSAPTIAISRSGDGHALPSWFTRELAWSGVRLLNHDPEPLSICMILWRRTIHSGKPTYEELAESEEHRVPHFPHLHKQMRGLYYVPKQEVHMHSSVERQREIVAEHIRCENEHDWPGVHDTFVQDDRAYYDVVPLGVRFKGIDGVRNFYRTIATALPDLRIEVVSEYDVPACSIREVVITGTHKGEYLGLQPLGNKVRGELAAFYLFNEDCTKLIAERIYYDQAGLAAQMQAKQAGESA